MIKRILCMALALLMLTGAAYAEDAYQATLTFQATTEGVLELLGSGEDDAADLAKGIAQLLGDAELQLNYQESGVYAALSLKDTMLVDMGIFGEGHEAYLFSNLLPGHYIDASVTPEEAASSENIQKWMESMDWLPVVDELLGVLITWIEGIPATQEHGRFVGDAYDDGVLRRTFNFDDTDVARLVDEWLNVLDAHGVNDDMLEALMGEGGAFASIRERNAAVAQANRYRYILHFVEDRNGNTVGASLVTIEGDQQVMTLSLGLASNGIRFVWGYGLNERNYYIECVFIDDGSTDNVTAAAYSITVFEDLRREGFGAVKEYIDYVVMLHSGKIRLETHEDALRWKMDTEVLNTDDATLQRRWVLDGKLTLETGAVEQTLAMHKTTDEEACLSIELQGQPCEPISWSTEGLKGIAPDDDATLDDVINDSVTQLMIKLFQLIPSEILTKLIF